MKTLLQLQDLLDQPHHFVLSKEGKEILLAVAIRKAGNIMNLSCNVTCHHDTIRNLAKGRTKSIRGQHLDSLLKYANIAPEKFQTYIVGVKRWANHSYLKLKLPVVASPDLALLIAKTCGDGGISSDYRFHYTNSSVELIREVAFAVQSSLGRTGHFIQDRPTHGTFDIRFPSTVGFLLTLVGSPLGSKIDQDFGIPTWVMYGTDEIKSAFLRGLFDDECTVDFRPKMRTRRISISFGKEQSRQQSLKRFLLQIKKLLNEFCIESSDIRNQVLYQNKIMLMFSIYRKENLQRFFEHVGFTHKSKNRALEKAINSYQNIHVTRENILKLLYELKCPLSISQIAEKIDISKGLAKFHVYRLQKNNLIVRHDGRPICYSFK